MALLRRLQPAAVMFVLLCVMGVNQPEPAKGTKKGNELSAADVSAIKTTIEAYRTSWLANAAKGVLMTFTQDAVLLPAHGAPAVVGKESLEKYWFTPGGPPTTITRLDITVEQVDGNGTVAFARGLDNVGWIVTENGRVRRHYHPGTYLNVMRKLPDGSWRIQVHMWDDGPEQVD